MIAAVARSAGADSPGSDARFQLPFKKSGYFCLFLFPSTSNPPPWWLSCPACSALPPRRSTLFRCLSFSPIYPSFSIHQASKADVARVGIEAIVDGGGGGSGGGGSVGRPSLGPDMLQLLKGGFTLRPVPEHERGRPATVTLSQIDRLLAQIESRPALVRSNVPFRRAP